MLPALNPLDCVWFDEEEENFFGEIWRGLVIIPMKEELLLL